MDIKTTFGICKNVDLDHMKLYGLNDEDTVCFCFDDYIEQHNEDEYLLFFFELHKDENNKFYFFVEEGLAGGEANIYDADISKEDQEYIKKLYYEYIRRN